MPKYANSSTIAFVPTVPVVFFVSVAFATIVGSIYSPAQADSTCIEQPNQPAPEGARWHFRYDRAIGRKCWFLADASTGARDVAAPQMQFSATTEPSLSSRLASLFGSLTGSSGSAAPEANPTSAPRKTQGSAPNAIKTKGRIRADQRGIVEGHAGKHTVPALTELERDQLFEAFLQWHESQRINNR